jgi:DNA-directed RNA polymerase subunit M/transcription elongation factor TFIIS
MGISPDHAEPPEASQQKRASRFMTIQFKGAIFARQEGSTVQYRYKCEKCGHIEGTLRSTTADGAGRIISTSFNCYKCDHQQQVAMLE